MLMLIQLFVESHQVKMHLCIYGKLVLALDYIRQVV